MNNQLAIATIIHDQIGTTLKDIFGSDAKKDPELFSFDIEPDELLSQLLEVDGAQADEPPNVGLVIRDIIGFSIRDFKGLLDDKDSSANPLAVFERLRASLPFLGVKEDALKKLFTAEDSDSIKDAGEALSGRLEGLRSFLGTDIGAILPLATLDSATPANKLVNLVENTKKALLEYLFKKDGYETVDRANIVAPVHISDLPSIVVDAGKRKNTFSPATAEHYLRDTIRVTQEAAYDSVRDLRNWGDLIKKALIRRQEIANGKDPVEKRKDAVEKKFINWLRGFSSMAESASMRGVEMATRGVAEYQTNPLIAAAAGSFAGTVARKIAQDSFLKLLSKELGL